VSKGDNQTMAWRDDMLSVFRSDEPGKIAAFSAARSGLAATCTLQSANDVPRLAPDGRGR